MLQRSKDAFPYCRPAGKKYCLRPSTFLGRLDVSRQTLDFGRQEFGEVRAGTFRVAMRFFLAELSGTNHCGKISTLVGPQQLRQKDAQRHT